MQRQRGRKGDKYKAREGWKHPSKVPPGLNPEARAITIHVINTIILFQSCLQPRIARRSGQEHLCDLQLLTPRTCPNPASYFCRTPPGSSFKPSSFHISITEAPCLYSSPLQRRFSLSITWTVKALGIFPSLACEMGKMRREGSFPGT